MKKDHIIPYILVFMLMCFMQVSHCFFNKIEAKKEAEMRFLEMC
jgi:hypothetical protein